MFLEAKLGTVNKISVAICCMETLLKSEGKRTYQEIEPPTFTQFVLENLNTARHKKNGNF